MSDYESIMDDAMSGAVYEDSVGHPPVDGWGWLGPDGDCEPGEWRSYARWRDEVEGIKEGLSPRSVSAKAAQCVARAVEEAVFNHEDDAGLGAREQAIGEWLCENQPAYWRKLRTAERRRLNRHPAPPPRRSRAALRYSVGGLTVRNRRDRHRRASRPASTRTRGSRRVVSRSAGGGSSGDPDPDGSDEPASGRRHHLGLLGGAR